MNKPKPLKKGDTIAVVSLSRGVIGEEFCNHNILIGVKRLEKMGFKVIFMPNSLKGIKYIEEHPEKRAKKYSLPPQAKKPKKILKCSY